MADELRISYEHARKICRGEAVLSKRLYLPLATLLKLDENGLVVWQLKTNFDRNILRCLLEECSETPNYSP